MTKASSEENYKSKNTLKVLKERPESDHGSELPSICSMLEMLISRDAHMVERTMIQVEKSKKIVLRTESEDQMEEINNLDTRLLFRTSVIC